MMRPLPPLNALRAFETAARHLSFTKAAAELNVTPAAVSHQIKALEELLGVLLFRRLPRALRLTDAGQAALPILGQGFEKLSQAVEQIRAHSESGLLTISVSPSFGALWLVPRLERFRARHPEIETRIDGTDRRVDLTRGDADVALRYGPGGYDGVRVDRLFGQVNTPVCSPALLRGAQPMTKSPQAKQPLRSPEDLRHHTLLHIVWKDAEASWRMWLLAAGLPDIDPTRGPHFTQESMAVEAALDGQGVALVGDILVADHLAAGRLVRPFDPSLSTPLTFAYYLLSTNDSAEQPKVTAFRTWLLEEARATRPEARERT
ncbi:transcriptional regulator GcvA [Denitrobaculum tricleocarpae]|uniref:Transcriptional regulator GcvA n=1 Tax=Denitrobaculum tricleocarpae TaxID=2591009 RepID=A0A545T5H8_9PROT|nr:transcriptional regulator GcvA [Denitrobaculum tricleocarpae]TQV72469.1 transcriptional regulator GcvA [Denitrobaculum tricleocarpae]